MVISCHTFPRRCLNVLIYVVVSMLVLAAVLLSLARLLLPTLEDYKPDIELWVSELVGQQVQIATLDAAWYGLEPQLVLRGVQLLSDDRLEAYGHFQQARLGLNIISSMLQGRMVPGALTIEGARFVVLRHKDGHVSVQGVSSGAGGTVDEQTELLKDWFFKQRVLDVKNSDIVWRDLKSGSKTWEFSNVNLRFRNDSNRHVITGEVSLPEALGSKLKIAVDVYGDLLSGEGWFGNAFVSGDHLNLKEWNENFALQHLNIVEGTAGLRVWTQWRKAQLYSAQGSLEVTALQALAKNAAKLHVVDNLSTLFSAQKVNQLWEATLDQIQVTSRNRTWPQTRLDVKFLPKFEKVEAELAYIDLNEVLPLAAFLQSNNSGFVELIEQYNPKGVVSNLKIVVNREQEAPELFVGGVLSHFQSRPVGKVPGIDGFDGEFEISNNAVKIIAPKQAVILNYPSVYTEKGFINSFQGVLLAQFGNEQFELLGKDLQTQYEQATANGAFHIKSDKVTNTTLLDLAFYIDGGKVAYADRYTPVRLLPPAVGDWLSHSLLDGTASHGGIMFYGNVKDFPFTNNEGVFNVNLNVKDSRLSFAEHWPLIEDINGVLDLRSSGFEFFGEHGETVSSALSNVRVAMPNFRDPQKTLLIDGEVNGDSRDKMRYLHNSPLENLFAKHLWPLEVEGGSRLHLNLEIPLADVVHTRAEGVLVTEDNDLYSEDWKLDFENLNAELVFVNEVIEVKNLSATMGAIQLHGGRVWTEKKSQGLHLNIDYRGMVDEKGVQYALGHFIEKAHWGTYLNGSSMLDFMMDIPLYTTTDGNSPKITMQLSSNLQNMEVKLPQPFAKPYEAESLFSLYTELSGKSRNLNIRYGDMFAGFEFISNGEQQQINRGAVNFSGPAELPSEHGFRYTGNLKTFSWAEWSPLIFPSPDQQPLFESEGGSSTGSHYFDVAFDKLEIFGSDWHMLKLQASSSAQQWAVHLDGDEVLGKVFVPMTLDKTPLRVKLDKLYLKREKSEAESHYIDPRQLPAVELEIADFNYNAIPFGELSLSASKIDSGLFLDKFHMANADVVVDAKGNWTEISQQQKSEFSIQMGARNLGNALQSWGYANALDGGKGLIDIDAFWQGKPSDFDFKLVEGRAEVELKELSLLDFDIGAAKMFGLLLPRRLLLDFRDVFKEGMHFDTVSGRYKIENGDAFTSGLKLTGPIADIELAGRIGLVSQDYDQVVTINQHLVSDSLPIVAALVNTNPILGAQVYVVKKLFENQIDDILSVQYTLSGGWADPVVKKVGEDTSSTTQVN